MICGGKKANIHRELYFCPSHLTLLPPEEEFLNTPVGFPGGLVVKNLPTNAGDTEVVGSVPGWGRSPGEGNGNPLQYSCLGNAMDRGAWRATVHGDTKYTTNVTEEGLPWWLSGEEPACQRHQRRDRGSKSHPPPREWQTPGGARLCPIPAPLRPLPQTGSHTCTDGDAVAAFQSWRC